MPALMDGPTNLVRSESAGETLIGFLAAALLLLLVGSLLPAGRRGRARQGAVLLGVSLACFLAQAFPLHPHAERLFVFVETFTLLASIGRTLVVLLIDVLAERRAARPAPRTPYHDVPARTASPRG